MIKLTALNVRDILNDADAGSTERSGTCAPDIIRFDDSTATADFVTRCATSRNAWEERIQFIDFNYLTPEDEREEVHTFDELKANYPEVVQDGDIMVFCNCPAFQYFYSYIADQLEVSLSPEDRFPTIRNPNLEGSVCKHLIAVFKRFLV